MCCVMQGHDGTQTCFYAVNRSTELPTYGCVRAAPTSGPGLGEALAVPEDP